MKKRKGITLVSLIIYVVAFSIVVGVITAITLTDDVIVNMTRYSSGMIRPEEVRLIALLDRTENDISRSLEYISLDEYDMLWYVKRKDQTENGIVKRVPLGKDAEMVIKNVTNSISMTGNYKKIENNRNGEIELDLVFKLGKKIEEKYYVKGN